jgi:hypothetical protein
VHPGEIIAAQPEITAGAGRPAGMRRGRFRERREPVRLPGAFCSRMIDRSFISCGACACPGGVAWKISLSRCST